MGAFASRLRRYKSKAELLEILEQAIRKKEIDRQFEIRNRDCVKRCSIIAAFVIFAILVILNLVSTVPDFVLLIYPVVAIIIIIGISRSYTLTLRKDQYKLYRMREEKKQLLEEVKITENYVVAKELLEKYGSSENLHNSNSTNNVYSDSHKSTTALNDE